VKPPAFDSAALEEMRKSLYPEPFKSRMGDRRKRKLGDAGGLTQFGVNLVTLGPNAQSALRHWHTGEDEFVYVLDGEVTLITNAGEQVLRAGQFACFKAGSDDAHHFVNKSNADVKYLEVGSRRDDDVAHYPDDDLMWLREGDVKMIAAHKDGTKY
jgi:uncharacterized cupin superfamily protein